MPDKHAHDTEQREMQFATRRRVCRAHPVSSGFYPVSLCGIFRGKCFLEPEVDA